MAKDTDLDDWLTGEDDGEGEKGRAAEAGADDVWGGESDDDGDGDLFSAESSHTQPQRESLAVRQEKALRAKHFKEGFREAVAQAREDALQEGFGDGFKEAFALGLRTGRLVGLCTTMQQLKEGEVTDELKQMGKESEDFAKRPIDEEKLARMEGRMQEIQL